MEVDQYTLRWKRFSDFRTLRDEFRDKPCIYLQTDRSEEILRIGQTEDIYNRYKGGTAYALVAAMHKSGNLLFVAEAPKDEKTREDLEQTMIHDYDPPYCNQRKKHKPVKYAHEGDIPKGFRPKVSVEVS